MTRLYTREKKKKPTIMYNYLNAGSSLKLKYGSKSVIIRLFVPGD